VSRRQSTPHSRFHTCTHEHTHAQFITAHASAHVICHLSMRTMRTWSPVDQVDSSTLRSLPRRRPLTIRTARTHKRTHTNAHMHACLIMIRWMFYIAVVVIPIVGAVLSSTPARHAVPKLVAALRWRWPNPHALRYLGLGAWTINATEMVSTCVQAFCHFICRLRIASDPSWASLALNGAQVLVDLIPSVPCTRSPTCLLCLSVFMHTSRATQGGRVEHVHTDTVVVLLRFVSDICMRRCSDRT
jgi:hypothetical protein